LKLTSEHTLVLRYDDIDTYRSRQLLVGRPEKNQAGHFVLLSLVLVYTYLKYSRKLKVSISYRDTLKILAETEVQFCTFSFTNIIHLLYGEKALPRWQADFGLATVEDYCTTDSSRPTIAVW
jgi:hypothetical protein